MEWITTNNTQILISVFSAFIFIFLVFIFFRPWFYISRKISKEGESYKFKVINFTLIKCTDISIHLRKVTETDAYPKGKDVKYEILNLDTSSFVYISGLISGLLQNHRPNCMQIKDDNHNLSEIIKADGTYLELIVIAKHGISNLQTTKKRTFKHTSYVNNGLFKSGLSFKIIEN